ncbi:VWA domain-containing protein [candidate division KSB3 bacterium]|uniref:VWA domain-containing protein n=1 Tax=candidate division KSB3 bacterium TaxID=2044937 RepID=A0A9D5JU10_9BACT|nr:VWA domain-containing protein [candidate division KSB3 bacterium]MBD3323666.1 VWA domain-containing protein [candidate division KSB3 bacterium]
MRFAYPVYLHFLWLIPLFVLLVFWAAKARQRSLDRFGDKALVAKLSASVSRRRQKLKLVLLLLTVLLLCLAIARPQLGTHAVPVKAEGIELVFALDVSLSMLAEDMTPNRLTRAKQEISALLDKLRGDRVGIVVFAGTSFIQCPLTFDYSAVKLFLDAVDTTSISVPGTAIADALRTSLRAFENSPVESSNVIILLTDGESHTGDPLSVAEDAEKQGVKIYTIGIGSEQGELIPIRDEQGNLQEYKKDREGNVVMTKLDQLALEKIAVLTDGQFYRVSSGGIELEKVYADISQMEKTLQETRLVTHYEEQYQYFLALALILLLAETFLTDRRTVSKSWQGRFR